jgi:hypothetical protein
VYRTGKAKCNKNFDSLPAFTDGIRSNAEPCGIRHEFRPGASSGTETTTCGGAAALFRITP